MCAGFEQVVAVLAQVVAFTGQGLDLTMQVLAYGLATMQVAGDSAALEHAFQFVQGELFYFHS